MKPQDWRQLICAYYDNALEGKDEALVKELLSNDPQCRAYYEELTKLSSALKRVKDENLSPDAENKILKNVKKERDMLTLRFKQGATVFSMIIIMFIVVQRIEHGQLQDRVRSSSQYLTESTRVSQSSGLVNQLQVARKKTGESIQLASLVEKNSLGGRLKSSADGSGDQLADGIADIGKYDVRTASGAQSARVATNVAYEPYYQQSAYMIAPYVDANTAEYKTINDNNFQAVVNNPLSTFSMDVDTSSYSNIRRFLSQNQMPPKDAVRIEEMVNYFSYNYPQAKDGEAFSVTTNVATCPWNKTHQLLHIGLKGRIPNAEQLAPSNLVFLIDVSGSMGPVDRLPLIKEGLKMMVRQLRAEDKVSLVVYAGSAGEVLSSTSGDQKQTINNAIDNLNAGGSTAGGEGIELAYNLAKKSFIAGGNNRVILATDGDFNVGVSDTAQLTRIIEEKRKDGIFLTVLGVGQDNLKDGRMMQIADVGNGNYYYLDTLKEAQKVLVRELGSTIYAIAKDVKIQIEFNPNVVKEYRLIGYEKRVLASEDFNNDKKDAGEIGAGHTVTALYEIIPTGVKEALTSVDPLKYQKTQTVASDEMLTVKLRYKEPNEDVSKLISQTIKSSKIQNELTGDFAWAGSVAEFGMLLRNSEFKGDASYDHVIKILRANMGEDKFGLKAEFIGLVETAQTLAPNQTGTMQFKE